MKCKHELTISKCDHCLTKVLTHLLKTEKRRCKCYANAFIMTPSQSGATVIRTFTQEELAASDCLSIELTSVCNGSQLQLGNCQSPQDKWCKIIDRENKFVTSVQVPRECGGCYNFDLSASVGMSATINLGFPVPGAVPLLFSTDVALPITVDLKLCEQLPREVCVADEVADTPESCFTAVTFPIIDAPCATETLSGTDLGNLLTVLTGLVVSAVDITSPNFSTALARKNEFSNLAVSGTVCLRGCQRLVPCITIRDSAINQLLDLSVSLLSQGALTLFTFTNIRLQLSCLSLKLVRLDNCPEDCRCQARPLHA